MQQLTTANNIEIQSKIRWFPSLNIKYQVVDEDRNETLGEIVVNPAWSMPFLWLAGWILNLGLIAGGGYWIFQGAGNQKWIGAGLAVFGLLFAFVIRLHSFLASRASSTIDIRDSRGETLVTATKGWAFWKPTFTVEQGKGERVLGQSRQSVVWGDCRYTLWDPSGNTWGSIRRRPFGFQYRVFKGSDQVARFRRKWIDTRKLMTGIRSYVLQFQSNELSFDERSFVLGTIAFVDVLVRQKRIKTTDPKTSTTKTKEAPSS